MPGRAASSSTASSRILSAFRASPPAITVRSRSASGSAVTPESPSPRSRSASARSRMPTRSASASGCEHVHAAAREQRGVDLEGRVLGGRPHQHDVALLDIGQEGVLLRLVEAVDLVHEEDGAPPAPGAIGLGLRHHLPDLLHAREHGREGHEARARHLGHEQRQRGLAGARRAPEDHGVEPALLERSAQDLARPDEVALADHLVQRAGPHPVGERPRRRGSRRRGGRRVEEIHRLTPRDSAWRWGDRS